MMASHLYLRSRRTIGALKAEQTSMSSRSEKVMRFRALHRSGCFTIPNPWDIGGARMMTKLGFKALATTSSGYAFSKGKVDMTRDVDRDETLQYAAAIAAS